MALFGKKKPENSEHDDSVIKPKPAKARKWFDHARAMADSFNFETAILYYAQGVRLDPGSLQAHEAILDAAIKHHAKGGKPATSKELRIIEGSDPATKLAQAEFAWAREIDNPALSVKVLDAAIKAEQLEFGNMIAARVLAITRRSKKLNRNVLVQLKDLFSQVGAWNEAIAAGELALELNPTDKNLSHELKDLAAQRAMDQGGYEAAAGKEGGFRDFVKDMDKQKELAEEESLAGTSGSTDRVIARAKAAWEASPESPDLLNKYGQLLRKKSTPESFDEAKALYMKGFETIGEYRFKMHAGDITISQITAEIAALEEAGDTVSIDERREALLKFKVEEFQERGQRYPTDRTIKYTLGELAFAQNDLGLAMECFQKSKDEPKYRVRAGHMLGKSFAAEGWHSDAVAEYRETLAALDATEADRELEIRYDLMCALIAQAADEQSVDLARDAMEICSMISRKDITYKDIRGRRREVDTLVKELS